MMMITSKRKKSAVSPSTFILTALVLVIVVIVGVWREAAARVLWSVAEPVMHLRNALQSSEAEVLRAELVSTKAKLADRDVLYAENLDLKKRLNRDANTRTVLAAILMRPPGVPYDTFVIDAGAREGVAVGDLVSAGGTTLIGTVSNVYNGTARVVLFSAPGTSYQGQIAGRIPISVEGQGGGSLRGQVPAGSVVHVGESVLLPGIAGGFASVISYIEHTEGESFQTIYMHLPVNPFELRHVEVWKERQPTNELQ
ncbi:MAG: rod shape-determining protein MreC [Patescibacteria group bacterium]